MNSASAAASAGSRSEKPSTSVPSAQIRMPTTTKRARSASFARVMIDEAVATSTSAGPGAPVRASAKKISSTAQMTSVAVTAAAWSTSAMRPCSTLPIVKAIIATVSDSDVRRPSTSARAATSAIVRQSSAIGSACQASSSARPSSPNPSVGQGASCTSCTPTTAAAAARSAASSSTSTRNRPRRQTRAAPRPRIRAGWLPRRNTSSPGDGNTGSTPVMP